MIDYMKLDNFKTFESTRGWSGKPLPKDATELFFKLSDTSNISGRFQILASIPNFTNKKGKSIIFNSIVTGNS